VLNRGDQRGFTLVELAVAMSLMLLVSGALLAALESGTTAERHASTRIDEEQSVRLVLAQFTRDVRNATSLAFPSAPAPWPADEVDLTDGGVPVVWAYTPTTGVLQREIGGNPSVSLRGLTNTSGTVFESAGLDGGDLFTDASATRTDAATCAATLTAAVTSRAQPPSAPFTETASAPLQALVTDRRGCP
jgi:prepilin-type N-terminal cleavage/methylation domain-containing protein